MRRIAIAVVLLLTVAGCGGDDEESALSGTTATTASTTTTTASTTTTVEVAQAPPVVLTPSGVEIDGALLEFGSPADAAVAAIDAVIDGTAEQQAVDECPAGPAETARWGEELSVTLQDGALVGWSIGELSLLALDSGLKSGATLAEVQAAHPDATVMETSLGRELWVESQRISGLLREGEDVLVGFWAGVNCIFR